MTRLIILTIVIVLVVAGWTGAWFWGAGQISAYEKTLEAADGVTTPKLSCKSFGVGGWPFGFDLTCTGATVTLADTTVTASGLKATALVYDPTHVLVFAQSPVGIADAFTGSQSRVDFKSAEASARLDGWRIGRISVVVEAPVWNDTVLDDQLIARADHLEAHLVDVPEDHDAKAGLASVAEYAEVDHLSAPGFQVNSGESTFEGRVTDLPDDVRTYGDPALLKRWQAAGGKFLLAGFKGDDGDSNFSATGTLGLDTQGRVEGQLKLNSKGVVERLGDLIPAQLKPVIVGGQAADGSYSQTVNIAGGVVFTGLVPTAAIPSLY
ncbi:MAG TPA: DUF2125 domain-containing protein [Devosia sp.]|jgi:hypothetical protein|nr:DUF2125 domain-containing protein [Devosia sp.]